MEYTLNGTLLRDGDKISCKIDGKLVEDGEVMITDTYYSDKTIAVLILSDNLYLNGGNKTRNGYRYSYWVAAKGKSSPYSVTDIVLDRDENTEMVIPLLYNF